MYFKGIKKFFLLNFDSKFFINGGFRQGLETRMKDVDKNAVSQNAVKGKKQKRKLK